MTKTATITATITPNHTTNWTSGTLTLDGAALIFQAKVYDEPSEYGINGGRISKLWIVTAGQNRTELFNYDRGHDVNHLTDEGVDQIVAAIEAAA